jgi:hypothetical protein
MQSLDSLGLLKRKQLRQVVSEEPNRAESYPGSVFAGEVSRDQFTAAILDRPTAASVLQISNQQYETLIGTNCRACDEFLRSWVGNHTRRSQEGQELSIFSPFGQTAIVQKIRPPMKLGTRNEVRQPAPDLVSADKAARI